MAMSNRFRDVIYHLERHKKPKKFPPKKTQNKKTEGFVQY
jgi:hypothetical protein